MFGQGKRRRAAFRYVERTLGLSRPDASLRYPPLIRRLRLVGVIDRFPVEFGYQGGGEDSPGYYYAKVTVIGLPDGLRTRRHQDIVRKPRWARVDCESRHREMAVRATDMSALDTFLSEERIATLCGFSFTFTLEKQVVRCTVPVFGSLTHNRLTRMVRNASDVAQVLRANYGKTQSR